MKSGLTIGGYYCYLTRIPRSTHVKNTAFDLMNFQMSLSIFYIDG